MIFFLAGAYLGIVIDAKNYKGSIEGVNNTNLRKTLTRIVLSALPAIPIYVCPLYLIAPRRYVFIIFTLKYALPSFLITFLLFGHSKMIYERLGLIREDDVEESETSMNLGKLEEAEEEKEYLGKKQNLLFNEGLTTPQSTF